MNSTYTLPHKNVRFFLIISFIIPLYFPGQWINGGCNKEINERRGMRTCEESI
jgi:hypothetical protein